MVERFRETDVDVDNELDRLDKSLNNSDETLRGD